MRQAICGYGSKHTIDHKQVGYHGLVDSSPSLAFFENTGPDSNRAITTCLNCHYHKVAHANEPECRDPERTTCKCLNFEPHGPWEFDTYYCGCYGWE